MLGEVKYFIKLVSFPCIYIGGLGTALLTVFKDVRYGFFLLVFLIPQPNIWYKLHQYPFGKDYLDILIVSIFLGLFIQKKGFLKTRNSILICSFVLITYFAFWISSINFNLAIPVTFANPYMYEFKNYVQMILLYYIAVNVVQDEDQHKIILLIICFVLLIIAVRNFRNFSGGASFDYLKRASGPFWQVGLGANHCGAFFVDYCAVFLGMFFFEKNKKIKIFYLATVLFGLHPIFFSYSRGCYLALLVILMCFGIFKKRSLLIILIVVVIFWQALLPPSVVDRILMTKNEDGEIENSAGGRLELWAMALDLFYKNPVVGSGYNSYAMTFGGTESEGGQLAQNQDVHNFYMRILCEQGIVGISIYLFLLFSSLRSGIRLYMIGKSPFYKGLGFGFIGCVIGVVITNMFGDRWSYFVLGGYLWIIWGIVDRAILNNDILKESELEV